MCYSKSANNGETLSFNFVLKYGNTVGTIILELQDE
jgi:hypothetical protein